MSIMDKSWERIQEKTFTKWINSHLAKRRMEVTDITKDFRDGIKLINLLEIIGDEKIGKYNKKPRMEIQMRENIEKALKFIASRGVKLTAIGAGDIFEGNKKLILGMIWTVILRFQIAEISVEDLTAKEALLLWCQRKTKPYKNVNIKNFTWSWQDGLGFCALIHAHRPDLIDYESLSAENKMDNLNLAFDIAEKELGIPRFLDAEDMVDIKPDERSVMTYLSEYFKYFSKGQKAETAGRRISKVVATQKIIRELIETYEVVSSDLRKWIDEKIEEHSQRNFDNTLEGVQAMIKQYEDYKSNEKPAKSKELQELKALLTKLNIKIKDGNRPEYVPKEGHDIMTISQQWDVLEETDKKLKIDLDAELKRQQTMEKLAANFWKKVSVLEQWANKKEEYLQQEEVIETLGSANLKIKLLQAYEIEYEKSKKRLEECISIGSTLVEMGYKDASEVQGKIDELNGRWEQMNVLKAEKEEFLNNEQARHSRMEELRLAFSKAAKDYQTWYNNATNAASSHLFGDDLEAVRGFKEGMDKEHAEMRETNSQKVQEMKVLDDELIELGSKDNKYTTYTMQDIYAMSDELENLIKEREAAYAAELETQEIKESKRLEFAEHANKYEEFLEGLRAEINKVDGEPEDMLVAVEGLYNGGAEIKEGLDNLKVIDDEAKDLGIRFNPHTKHTYAQLKEDAEDLIAWIEKHIEFIKKEKIKKDKRLEFAELANDFDKFLIEHQKEIDSFSDLEPLEAIEKVKEVYQDGALINERLEVLDRVDREGTELNVGLNPYTKFSYTMLEGRAKQLHSYVANLLASYKKEDEMNKQLEQMRKENEERERIENLKLKYFDMAQELSQLLDDMEDFVLQELGTDLDAVQKQLQTYAELEQKKEEKLGLYDDLKNLYEELNAAGVTDYLGYPIEAVNERWESIAEKSFSEYRAALEEELKVQEENDNMCKEIAKNLEEINEEIKRHEASPDTSKELPEQIQEARDMFASLSQLEERVAAAIEQSELIVSRNANPKKYTDLSAHDVLVYYEQVKDLLSKRINVLEEQQRELEGSKVSKEQLEEFKELFQAFDKDNKNALYEYEFAGVLNALGDDLDDDEMKKVFEKYDQDNSGTIEFAEFTEFMINRVEDSDTPEQALESWRVIAKDKDFVTKEDMQQAGMKPEDIEYLISEMPKLDENAFDYVAYVKSIYKE